MTNQEQERSSDLVAGKTYFSGGYDGCDDNILATFGSAQLVRHGSCRFELRSSTAADYMSAREWISLFVHEAVVSAPPPQMPIPISVTGMNSKPETNQPKDTIVEGRFPTGMLAGGRPNRSLSGVLVNR